MGSEWFEKGAQEAVAEYCHSMDIFHSTVEEKFKDSNGNLVDRTLAFVSDIPGLVKSVMDGRGVKSPKLILSADGGQGLYLMLMIR